MSMSSFFQKKYRKSSSRVYQIQKGFTSYAEPFPLLFSISLPKTDFFIAGIHKPVDYLSTIYFDFPTLTCRQRQCYT